MWYIFAGEHPFRNIDGHSVASMAARQHVRPAVLSERMMPRELQGIMTRAWSGSAEDRPRAGELLEEVEGWYISKNACKSNCLQLWFLYLATHLYSSLSQGGRDRVPWCSVRTAGPGPESNKDVDMSMGRGGTSIPPPPCHRQFSYQQRGWDETAISTGQPGVLSGLNF
eukprot:767381-Hanusia_phi.AAC.1